MIGDEALNDEIRRLVNEGWALTAQADTTAGMSRDGLVIFLELQNDESVRISGTGEDLARRRETLTWESGEESRTGTEKKHKPQPGDPDYQKLETLEAHSRSSKRPRLYESNKHLESPVHLKPSDTGSNNFFTRPLLLSIGAGFIILGSFLPWKSVTSPFLGGTVNVSGMDGAPASDGFVTVILAGIVLFLAFLMHSGGSKNLLNLGVLILAGIVVIVAIVDMVDIQKTADEINTLASGVGVVRIGYGLWITTIAAILTSLFSALKFLE